MTKEEITMTSEGVHQTAYGYDLVWASTEKYTAKIKVFNRIGASTDLYFQTVREKTWFVNSGTFRIRWIDTKTAQIFEQEFTEGQAYTVPVNQPTQLVATSENASVTECGEADNESDVYRVISGASYENGK